MEYPSDDEDTTDTVKQVADISVKQVYSKRSSLTVTLAVFALCIVTVHHFGMYSIFLLGEHHNATSTDAFTDTGGSQNLLNNTQITAPTKANTSVEYLLACSPKVNVVFIKVHKAGSTTMANIFLRYGYKHNLSVAVPSLPNKVWLGWPSQINRNYILPPYRGSGREEDYNILAHHSVYNEHQMKSIMPENSVYTAILRNPYEHFLSAFRYLDVATVLKINAKDPLAEFIKHPAKYEKPYFGYSRNPISLTKNLMSYDMGMTSLIWNNTGLVQKYIRYLDSRFKLVLILEYLDESIILLKRYLCWRLEDVVFRKVLPLGDDGKHHLMEHTPTMRKQLYEWNTADHMLYDYFNTTLWTKVQQQSSDFYDEVDHFKGVLDQIVTYCDTANPKTPPLIIPKSRWDEQTHITHSLCISIKIKDLEFTDLFRAKYAKFNQSNSRGSAK